MPQFDEGLINGDAWGATQVDAMELAISDRGLETATTSQRLAITGARLFNGKHVFDTTLGEMVYYSTVDSTWHGTRCHAFTATGLSTSSAANTDITLYTGTLPTYGVAGQWQVRYMVQLTSAGGAAAGLTVIQLILGGLGVGIASSVIVVNPNPYTMNVIGAYNVAAGGGTVSIQATRNTAFPSDTTISTDADFRYHRIDAEWIPA